MMLQISVFHIVPSHPYDITNMRVTLMSHCVYIHMVSQIIVSHMSDVAHSDVTYMMSHKFVSHKHSVTHMDVTFTRIQTLLRIREESPVPKQSFIYTR